jgi:cell division protein FtsB
VETGIAPNELLSAPDEVLEAIVDYLRARNTQLEEEMSRLRRAAR